MVAPGFSQQLCFNPALVYLIAGFLIGLSLRYYMDRNKKSAKKIPPAPKKRRR